MEVSLLMPSCGSSLEVLLPWNTGFATEQLLERLTPSDLHKISLELHKGMTFLPFSMVVVDFDNSRGFMAGVSTIFFYYLVVPCM